MVEDKKVDEAMAGIAEAVMQGRHKRGMTQTELAKKAGVSDAIISLIERHKRKSMTVSTLFRIMTALNASIELGIERVEEEVE